MVTAKIVHDQRSIAFVIVGGQPGRVGVIITLGSFHSGLLLGSGFFRKTSSKLPDQFAFECRSKGDFVDNGASRDIDEVSTRTSPARTPVRPSVWRCHGRGSAEASKSANRQHLSTCLDGKTWLRRTGFRFLGRQSWSIPAPQRVWQFLGLWRQTNDACHLPSQRLRRPTLPYFV